MYRNLKAGEDTEQMGVMDWADVSLRRYPDLELLHHIPNGGRRNVKEAARFKAMGVKPGVPDLCLPVPRGGYAGMYIEMKYGRNKPTDNQKFWITRLRELGYRVEVCYSGREAVDALEDYLKMPRTGLCDADGSMSKGGCNESNHNSK